MRELDVYDDALMRRVYAITRAAMMFERPHAPMWSEHENTLGFREVDPGERATAHGLFDGDELVGTGVHVAFLADNTEKAFVAVFVEPERRGRGIGSAMVQHLAELTRGQGRTTLLAQSYYPEERRYDHPYVRWAEKNGFHVGLIQIRRDLALPVPAADVQAWIDEAAEHHAGYRIDTYEGLPAAELLPSLVHAMNQLPVDAPQGDETWEPEGTTPETFEVKHRNNVEAGRLVYHTVAVHEASNEVVAYTTLTIFQGDEGLVRQWGTLVLRGHRGHRLGLAVKARALADLQHAHPERTRITTVNAETNAAMVGINERMGFEKIEMQGEFQRHLD
jgi:GNAT superfamily N-acetyltransferase